ncbi:lysophospholipid acyltransferase family protein [soil metagenome]
MPSYTFKQRVILAVVPRLASLIIRCLGVTLRYEDVVDEGAEAGYDLPSPAIYTLWHRTLLACAWRFRNRNIAILISESFDGELIARTVRSFGFVPIRGSSSRGGAPGLRNLERAYRAGQICAITADGPRGPLFVAKPGAAQLATLVGDSVRSFYVLPERAWQLRSWDRFLIPKPFSRVVITWPRKASADTAAVQSAMDRSVELAEMQFKR